MAGPNSNAGDLGVCSVSSSAQETRELTQPEPKLGSGGAHQYVDLCWFLLVSPELESS